MSISLVTGYQGEEHVTSLQVASLNKATYGEDQGRIFSKGQAFAAEMIDANTIRIHGGDMLLQGRHIHMDDSDYEDLTIDTGSAGYNRTDIVAVEYTRDTETGVEDAKLKVIKGESTTGTPAIPSYTVADIDSDYMTQLPIWRVTINGITPGTPVRMLSVYDPLISNTDLFNKIYPVGSIYMTATNVNPSTLFGGTWSRWGEGRVPVGVASNDTKFNTVEKTGGEQAHALTVAELPAHTHTYAKSDATTGGTAITVAQMPRHNHTYGRSAATTGQASNNSGVAGSRATQNAIKNALDGLRSSIAAFDNDSAYNAINFNRLLSVAFTATKSKVSGLSFTNPTITLPTLTANDAISPTTVNYPTQSHTHSIDNAVISNSGITGSGEAHTHSIGTSSTNSGATGSGTAHNVIQPYITCYMWKRVA